MAEASSSSVGATTDPPAGKPRSTWLISPRIMLGLSLPAAVAAGMAALASWRVRKRPSTAALLAGGAVVLAAEACFAWWWEVAVRAPLDALDTRHEPGNEKARADFQKVIAIARMVKSLHHRKSLEGPPSADGCASRECSLKGSELQTILVEATALSPEPSEVCAAVAAAASPATVLSPRPPHAPTIPVLDIEQFLSEWFLGVEFSELYQGNVAELLAYAFYYKSFSEMEAAGLGDVPMQMALELEEVTGTHFRRGYNPGLRAMFHLWEPLPCSYRPLAFYLAMELTTWWTRACMALALGFRTVGSWAVNSKSPLRMRPLPTADTVILGREEAVALLHGCGGQDGMSEAAAADVATEAGSRAMDGTVRRPAALQPGESAAAASSSTTPERQHRGRRQQQQQRSCSVNMFIRRQPRSNASEPEPTPLLFLHGVGAGLFAYLPFLDRLAGCGRTLVCMEARHISMRLTPRIPTPNEVADDVVVALDALGYDKVVCVAHSYGTFVAACLVQHHASRLESLCLVDPVCLGVFLPNLVSGFVYRRPRLRNPGSSLGSLAMKWAMYFISTEVHMAATFCRRFFWSDVNLWMDDLPPRTLIVISGNDDLLHVEEIRHILSARSQAKVLFHDSHRHSGFLMDAAWQEEIVQELKQLFL